MSERTPQKQIALQVVRKLQSEGFVALFAGGCVRDELLGRAPKDYDVATDAFPEEVEALFPKTLPIGKAFGVIAVIVGKQTVEVATFREESGTMDGRHPESIRFSAAKEDASRRDFTINGMFHDPVADEILDYVHGRRDLERERIVAIGDPRERFREDHLRMLRAVRFAGTLGFTLDPDTESALRELAPRIREISAERVETELTRALTESPRPGAVLKQLRDLGLLEHLLPDVMAMIGQEQPPNFHPEGDVFEHTCLMLDFMGENRANGNYTARELAYAVLLHDVGKPPTAKRSIDDLGETRVRFNGHAAVGAEIAERVLTELKFPNVEKRRIVAAIRGHMRFIDIQRTRVAKVRAMIGADTFDLDMELHRLDCLGSHRALDNHAFVRAFQRKLADEPALPEPWIRGNDLIELGLREGREIGALLKQAYDAQIEGRFENREQTLEWLRSRHGS